MDRFGCGSNEYVNRCLKVNGQIRLQVSSNISGSQYFVPSSSLSSGLWESHLLYQAKQSQVPVWCFGS